MKNPETGEYEVVVGNRQLLSGFFIVMLLCGVAFAMGYVVGQNAPRSSRPQADAAAPASAPEDRASQPSALPAPPPAASDSSAAPDPAVSPADAATQPSTVPARDTLQAAPAAATPAATDSDAAPGSFWQVLAVRQEADAQPFLQTLRDGGMPATLRKGTDGWVRLLVGPYSDRAAMAKAKEKLETQFRVRSLIRK